MKRSKQARQALFIHQAAIGDFLVCLRLLDLWNNCEARYRWSYLGKPSLGSLAQALGVIERYYDFEAGHWHHLFVRCNALPSEVERFFGQFSLILNALGPPDAVVSTNLAKLAPGEICHIDPMLPNGFTGHYWEHLVRQIDPRAEDSQPAESYKPSPDMVNSAREIFADRGVDPHRLVFIHPGASGPAKRWPMENFLQLAQAIRSHQLTPGFLIGPVEQEQFSQASIDQLRRTAPVWANLPLEQLAAMLHLSAAYVGNDNGISHLAAAVGTSTFVIFVATNPLNWQPLGPRVVVLKKRREIIHPQDIAEVAELIKSKL